METTQDKKGKLVYCFNFVTGPFRNVLLLLFMARISRNVESPPPHTHTHTHARSHRQTHVRAHTRTYTHARTHTQTQNFSHIQATIERPNLNDATSLIRRNGTHPHFGRIFDFEVFNHFDSAHSVPHILKFSVSNSV